MTDQSTMALVASEPLAALAVGDVDGELAQLPADARAETETLNLDALSGVYEASTIVGNTREVYAQRWGIFLQWCLARGLRALPAHPEVLRLHLLDLAIQQKAMSTLEVTYAAIRGAHRIAGLPSPVSDRLREAVTALRRALAERGRRMPIRLETLRAIVGVCKGDLLAARDRAMILLTYWARLRRSETAGLDCPLESQGDRLLVRLGPEIQDVRFLVRHEEAELCPVRALEAWVLQRAKCARPPLTASAGPLFVGVHRARRRELFLGKRIQGYELDRTLKRRLKMAGIDPTSFSPHDLRAELHIDPRARGGVHG
jgi:integrase